MKARWFAGVVAVLWLGASVGPSVGSRAWARDATVSLKSLVRVEVIAADPFAGRFDTKGKKAVVVEVRLSGPASVATISSADFALQYEANGAQASAPCVGFDKGFGIWDLASRGPVTDERDFNKEPKQRLLFLVPTAVTRGRVTRARGGESVEVEGIAAGTGK